MTLVRLGLPEDAEAIARLHVAAWRKAYRGIVPDEVLEGLDVGEFELGWKQRLAADPSILVAEVGGAVAGFAVMGRSSDPDLVPEVTGEVHGLYVAPEHWATGVGRALWDAAFDMLRDHGFVDVVIWTFAANERAHRFYRARGCSIDDVGHVEREYHGVFLPVVRFRAKL